MTEVQSKSSFPSLTHQNHIKHESNNQNQNRKRSNSQSQVVNLPTSVNRVSDSMRPLKQRSTLQFYVTLQPLNDTFVRKHLSIAAFPETTKLGRPTGTKHKPDVNNGYFDSRVLSRNHAQMFIDPSNGKLMLQDLGSSNGTYLNDVRLNNNVPMEVNIDDIVCLGFNVQAESTHKQISLKIENITIVNDVNEIKQSEKSIELKHLSFMENLYKQMNDSHDTLDITFESATFGDVDHDLNEQLLGLYSSTNMGLYNNSHIVNTSTLENVISLIVYNLSRVKQQSSSLNHIIEYFSSYTTQVDELNEKYVNDKFESHFKKLNDKLKIETAKSEKFKTKIKNLEIENLSKINHLNDKVKNLQDEKSKLSKDVDELKIEKSSIEENHLKIIKSLESEKSKLKDELISVKELADELALKAAVKDEQSQPREGEEDVSDAINGFIMDLSRTPSVRDNMKNLDSNSCTSIKQDLTPPSSDCESDRDNDDDIDDDHENNDNNDHDHNHDQTQQQQQNPVETEKELSSSSIILPLKDVEPFPKKVDDTSSNTTTIFTAKTDVNNTHNLNDNKRYLSTVLIAMSAMLIGFYIQKVI